MRNVVQGRRIVDVAHLAGQMICTNCKAKLHMSEIQKETIYGLASIFTVCCATCQHLNKVSTSKRHGSSKGPFDVNTKVALGMLA